MFAKALLIGAMFIWTSAAKAEDDASEEAVVIKLTCSGVMLTEGQASPGSRILADGVVNIDALRVTGFGIGSVALVSASDTKLAFASTPLQAMRGSHTIEGEIDRMTWSTRIVVRSTKDAARILIDMDLECQPDSAG